MPAALRLLRMMALLAMFSRDSRLLRASETDVCADFTSLYLNGQYQLPLLPHSGLKDSVMLPYAATPILRHAY